MARRFLSQMGDFPATSAVVVAATAKSGVSFFMEIAFCNGSLKWRRS